MYNLSYPYAIIFVQKYENERTKKQKCKNAKKIIESIRILNLKYLKNLRNIKKIFKNNKKKEKTDDLSEPISEVISETNDETIKKENDDDNILFQTRKLKRYYSEDECLIHASYIAAPVLQSLTEFPFIEIDGVTYYMPEFDKGPQLFQ